MNIMSVWNYGILFFIGGVILFIIYYSMIVSPASDLELQQSTCGELLISIQSDGMKPNYQHDVREWISKECWK